MSAIEELIPTLEQSLLVLLNQLCDGVQFHPAEAPGALQGNGFNQSFATMFSRLT
jgi:hypothetical protein